MNAVTGIDLNSIIWFGVTRIQRSIVLASLIIRSAMYVYLFIRAMPAPSAVRYVEYNRCVL